MYVRLSLFASLAVAIVAFPALAQPDFDKADAAVARLLSQYDAPGAQFAVAQDGSVAHAKSFGYANLDAKAPVDNDSIFALASCSKPLTAMSIMKLVDEKKLSIEDTAVRVLGLGKPADPRFANVTIRMLLDHSSGLRRDGGAVGSTDPTSAARFALRSKLQFAPGTKQVYSNLAFDMLGAIVEKVSGEKYQDYVRTNVLDPAGVTDEAVLDGAQPIAHEVSRYNTKGSLVRNNVTPGFTPAGGWVLSASDMMKILAAYDAGKIVSMESRAAMLAPPVPPLTLRSNGAAFGLGWDVVMRNPSGQIDYGKDGGLEGSFTWIEHRYDGIDFALFFNGGKNSVDVHRKGRAPVEAALGGA